MREREPTKILTQTPKHFPPQNEEEEKSKLRKHPKIHKSRALGTRAGLFLIFVKVARTLPLFFFIFYLHRSLFLLRSITLDFCVVHRCFFFVLHPFLFRCQMSNCKQISFVTNCARNLALGTESTRICRPIYSYD